MPRNTLHGRGTPGVSQQPPSQCSRVTPSVPGICSHSEHTWRQWKEGHLSQPQLVSRGLPLEWPAAGPTSSGSCKDGYQAVSPSRAGPPLLCLLGVSLVPRTVPSAPREHQYGYSVAEQTDARARRALDTIHPHPLFQTKFSTRPFSGLLQSLKTYLRCLISSPLAINTFSGTSLAVQWFRFSFQCSRHGFYPWLRK